MTQDRDYRRAVVNTVMKFQYSLRLDTSRLAEALTNFSRWALQYGVSLETPEN
jgi:ADP-dependent phosphofructokinase/glucokinase